MGGEQLRNGEENVRCKDKADVFFSLLAALTETTLLRITRLPDKPLINDNIVKSRLERGGS